MKTRQINRDVKSESPDLENYLETEITGLLREHEGSLLRYAARMLSDMEQAKDIVQESFCKLIKFRRAEMEDTQSAESAIRNFRAWLFRVTRNGCLDHLKSAGRRLEMSLEGIPAAAKADSDPPDVELEKKDMLVRIREAVMELDARSREVVLLKIDHGKSYREIAQIMELSVSNVGFILHHSMRKISGLVDSLNIPEGGIRKHERE